VAALAFLSVPAAQATAIKAHFIGVLDPLALQRVIDSPAPTGTLTTEAGLFQFNQLPNPGLNPDLATRFMALCIEPLEYVTPGSDYVWQLAELKDGANNIGGMGAAKADKLAELYGRYYPVFGTPVSGVAGQALQIATWEIVRESDPRLIVSSQNPAHGHTYYVWSGADSAALALAQQYLNALDGSGPRARNLRALTVRGAQDYVVQLNTPEPGYFGLVGLLSAAAIVLRRRRNKS
jgi:MYXO-CTERM domain-containing protein